MGGGGGREGKERRSGRGRERREAEGGEEGKERGEGKGRKGAMKI